jgi:hypothetical protein
MDVDGAPAVASPPAAAPDNAAGASAAAASNASGADADGAPLLGGDPLMLEVAAESATMRRFLARLAFANERSGRMNTVTYAVYAKAREASFTGNQRLTAAFAAALPAPPLRRTVLEAVSYLAYDHVADITEAANRIECEGSLTHVTEPLAAAAYAAAAAALPSLPEEVSAPLAALREREAAAAQTAALEAARAYERELLDADAQEAAAMGAGQSLSAAATAVAEAADAALAASIAAASQVAQPSFTQPPPGPEGARTSSPASLLTVERGNSPVAPGGAFSGSAAAVLGGATSAPMLAAPPGDLATVSAASAGSGSGQAAGRLKSMRR